MVCICFFFNKIATYTKGDVDNGKAIDINVGKGQNHNTKKSFSISRVQFDRRSEFGILGDMEVFFTYVTRPCDTKSQIPNWWDIPLSMFKLLCLIVENKGRLG